MLTKDKIKNKGIPPGYYERLAQVESSNNPNAEAKCPPEVPPEKCTAAGKFQFVERTWNGMVEQLGLDYTLEDRFDPIKSRKVVEAFTKKNASYLKKKIGREPTENELYLAHFLGMGGASKFLQTYQDFPDVDVSKAVSEGSLTSNPNVFRNKDGSLKTIREVYNWSENKMGAQGVKAPKDNSIWGYNEEGQVVSINPEYATEEQKANSFNVKNQYVDNLYDTESQESLTNFEKPTEKPIFEEDKKDNEEVPAWKKALDKKQEERNNILSYISQEGLDYQAPKYNRTVLGQQKFQDGGTFPVSENGLYDYPNQPVIVPTKDGKITMKGINYPVIGISNTGEEILMQPNQEYTFKGATEVLEIPQLN